MSWANDETVAAETLPPVESFPTARSPRALTPRRHGTKNRSIEKASVTTDADVLAAVNVDAFPDGQAVNHAALFGNSIEYDDEGSIIGARAMFQAYGLASDQDDDADINDEVFDWNGEFQVKNASCRCLWSKTVYVDRGVLPVSFWPQPC